MRASTHARGPPAQLRRGFSRSILHLPELTLRSPMSELRGESGVPEMGAATGASGVLRAGAGGGSRAREAHRAGAGPPGLLSMPNLHGQLGLLGVNPQRFLHQCLDSAPVVPVRFLRDVEERRRLFVDGCRAREAAFDANPPQMDSEAVAFALALTAAAAGPLAH